MFKNYFLIAVRNIIRQKSYSFINIFGLAIGITGALLVFMWVYDEITFDRFHENIDHIYRVEQDQFYNNESYHVNVTPYPSGEGWQADIPEIETAVRFAYTGSLLMKYDLKSFYESGIRAVDSSVFSVFTFPLKYGDPAKALTQPYSIVLTKELSEKFFGEENPLGKIIKVDNQYNFTVTGVLEKIPDNSSFQFEALVPFDFVKTTKAYSDHWGSNSITTTVKLFQNADPIPVDEKLTAVVKSNMEFEEGEEENYPTKFMLAPLKKMHLHAYFGYGHPPGQIQNVLIFATIGIFILLIACINYMNLSTARSGRRSREIGLRKVSGAYRKNIINQFFGESLVTTLFATVLALILVGLLLDMFNQLSGKQIDIAFLLTKEFIIGLLGMILFTSLVAGSYPAIYLSSFLPVSVLKGEEGEYSHKAWLRKVLVVVQFVLSIFLITGTFLVYKQLNYMQTRKLGYDKEHVMYIRMFGDINKSYDVIRETFVRNPEVSYVTASSHLPSHIGSNSGGVDWEGKDPELRTLISMSVVDFDYAEALKIPIVQGRSLKREFPSDLATDSTGSFLVNEEVVKIMGVDDPVGMRFSFLGISNGKIVGVMKNFHFHSMRNKIEPLAIAVAYKEYLTYIIIRLAPGDIDKTIKKLETDWETVLPDYPFEYQFLDEDYDNMYRSEKQMGTLLNYFTITAIIIALLGLFGLASFMAEKRTREIGVRKVFGSTAKEIISLLTWEFSKLVLIAIVIGIPLSWYFLHGWLQDYAFRTELNWWIFGLAAIFCLLVALLTVGFQAARAANKNPAQALRHE